MKMDVHLLKQRMRQKNKRVMTTKPTECEPAIQHTQTAKERTCLMCRDKFTSEHFGKRVCPKCRESNVWTDSEKTGLAGRKKKWGEK